jgi:hypothetical protein
VTICPCCGFKSANSGSGVSTEACLSCGAHSVGEPLPRPERELPSYGRSLLLAVTGAMTVLVFLTQTVIALVKDSSRAATPRLALASIIPFDFWSWVGAAETAAWQLKWLMIPALLVVLLGSRKLYESIRQSPTTFCGLRAARNGYFASAAVPLLVLILIGVTVPARLRHRQWGIEAGHNAQGYRIARALEEYRQAFGTLPSEPGDLSRLPDPDGSITAALRNVDASGYTVESEVAAVPTKKPRSLGGAVILNASLPANSDEPPSAGISFTNYQFRLPGLDKVLGNEDDLVLIDGVIYPLADVPRGRVGSRSAAQTRKP